ncbi:hypothetical protein IAU60_006806 [Kwoniella sp. DSM 27419]
MTTTEAMKHFLTAEKYAVIGRVMSDRSRFDNKVGKARDMPVTAVRPGDPSTEPIESQEVLGDATLIPDLANTSVSIVYHPKHSLGVLQSLFPNPPSPANEPRHVWFQPGADDSTIWQYVKERGIEDRFIGHGACVLRDGPSVLDSVARDKASKSSL